MKIIYCLIFIFSIGLFNNSISFDQLPVTINFNISNRTKAIYTFSKVLDILSSKNILKGSAIYLVANLISYFYKINKIYKKHNQDVNDFINFHLINRSNIAPKYDSGLNWYMRQFLIRPDNISLRQIDIRKRVEFEVLIARFKNLLNLLKPDLYMLTLCLYLLAISREIILDDDIVIRCRVLLLNLVFKKICIEDFNLLRILKSTSEQETPLPFEAAAANGEFFKKLTKCFALFALITVVDSSVN